MAMVKTMSRFFRYHPSIVCLLLLLAILYKYFFRLFAFLVASSPVFLFTAFFLGIVLVYSEPNVPKNDHVYKKISRVHCGNDRKYKRSRRRRFHDHVSSSESGSSESGGSETDIMPMLTAFHPLTMSVATSLTSLQDEESDVSSIDDGANNHEEDNHGDKEDINIVAWTIDDQKNIQNIGSLELERNQRLENLMSRRRVRKYMERNLIDLDGNESLPSIEELSKFSVQIPTVFVPRKNPFDLAFEEDEFPGSAPSALLPTRIPFDPPIPLVQASGGSVATSTAGASQGQPESGPVSSPPHRNLMMFRRHESFTAGVPYASDFRSSRFRPYFVTEKMAEEGVTVEPILEGDGEASENSDSRKSSMQDSDSVSSVSDQEIQKQQQELVLTEDDNLRQEQATHKEREVEPPLLISDSSDDDVSLPGEDANECECMTLTEDPSIAECHQEMDLTSEDAHQMSPYSDDGVYFEVSNIKLSVVGKEADTVNDDSHSQIAVAPVYDSSPSGNDKSASSISSALNEALLQQGGSDGVSSSWVAPSVASVEENETRGREISEIRERDIFCPTPVPSSSSQPPTTDAVKPGKPKASSKKAVFGFFRK